MNKIEEFLYHLKQNHVKVLEDKLNEISFNQFMKSSNIEELDDETINIIIDAIEDYISMDSNHMNAGDIEHHDGDQSVFEDGIYHTELHEINGYYFYRTPEGETYGLYSSLEDAESESWKY